MVGGLLRATRAEAYTTATEWARLRPGSTLVVGASLAADAEVAAIPALEVKKAGFAETAAALSTLRELLATGRACQDGSPDLERQALAARVTIGSSGLSLVPGERSDLLRAAVWALRTAVTQPPAAPRIDWATAR